MSRDLSHVAATRFSRAMRTEQWHSVDKLDADAVDNINPYRLGELVASARGENLGFVSPQAIDRLLDELTNVNLPFNSIVMTRDVVKSNTVSFPRYCLFVERDEIGRFIGLTIHPEPATATGTPEQDKQDQTMVTTA